MTVTTKSDKRRGEELEAATVKKHCETPARVTSVHKKGAFSTTGVPPAMDALADDLVRFKKTICDMLHSGHSQQHCMEYYRRSLRVVIKAHIKSCTHAPPLLPPVPSPPRRTLVLDMDKTLVFKEWRLPNGDHRPAIIQQPDFTFPVTYNGYPVEYHVKKRPHLDTFLTCVSKLYEVVLFTASEALVTSPVVDGLDPKRQIFSAVLCREACTAIPGAFLKDLGRLGRCLSGTLLLDDNPDSYMLHEENAIPIEEYSGFEEESGDVELLRLLPLLEQLAKEPGDVRPALAQALLLRRSLQVL